MGNRDSYLGLHLERPITYGPALKTRERKNQQTDFYPCLHLLHLSAVGLQEGTRDQKMSMNSLAVKLSPYASIPASLSGKGTPASLLTPEDCTYRGQQESQTRRKHQLLFQPSCQQSFHLGKDKKTKRPSGQESEGCRTMLLAKQMSVAGQKWFWGGKRLETFFGLVCRSFILLDQFKINILAMGSSSCFAC